ncbi:hypothetical protein [Ensifer sp. LC163]|uniref:hypothetical protein n=1 Tax=Ensifer sp. LC163 TaxID=1120652 RepID=UPI0008133E52|nr:hypothetical protein [Ensifer sp. LC163]OCP37462.1 hypothetical protein BC360_23125 [Ensifer sp. LC163]
MERFDSSPLAFGHSFNVSTSFDAIGIGDPKEIKDRRNVSVSDTDRPHPSTVVLFARNYLAQRDSIAKQLRDAIANGRTRDADKLMIKLTAHEKYIADNRLERFRKS